MTPEAQKIADAWLRASPDLGIEIISPFLLSAPDGQLVEYVALVPQFGSRRGMLLIFEDQGGLCARIAVASGYGYSCLNLFTYGLYDRDVFIDALNDWGWTDAQNPSPSWYTGEPWTA